MANEAVEPEVTEPLKAPLLGLVDRRVAKAPVEVTASKIAQRVLEGTMVGLGGVREGDLFDEDLPRRVKSILNKVDSPKRELTPEQAQETLKTLEARFQRNIHLHEGVKFEDVKKSLEANPEALWSVAQMEAKGHEPDVYNTNDKGFDLGTCSEESPESARNCVYDKQTADFSRRYRTDEIFNGSAEEMAQEMGIDLMDPNLYKNVLQKKGKFDAKTWSWLLTGRYIRSYNEAIYGLRDSDGHVSVNQYIARNHNRLGAFRGSLSCPWKA